MPQPFRITLPAVSASALLVIANVSPLHAEEVATAKSEVLLQADSSWNGKPYTAYPAGRPQLTMLKITIAPNTSLPWHTHPVPNAAYILSGDITLRERASGVTRTFHTGDSLAESVDDEHRGESGPNGAVILVTYAGTPGTPTSVPAKGEKPEY